MGKKERLIIDYQDFAIAALIFDQAFVESLRAHANSDQNKALVETVFNKNGHAVDARHVARELKISMDRAYTLLRDAEQAGLIRRANKTEKSNRKLYIRVRQPRFLPDPEKLFQKLKHLDRSVQFIHPITGEQVTYRRRH